jgi:hypothetical protein
VIHPDPARTRLAETLRDHLPGDDAEAAHRDALLALLCYGFLACAAFQPLLGDANGIPSITGYSVVRPDIIPGVPLILDLTNDAKEKAALKLIFSRQAMARPFAAPPNLPPERAKALRDAFDATMKDPAFLAEARKLDLEVRPVQGEKINALINEIYGYPADVVKIASDAIRNAR